MARGQGVQLQRYRDGGLSDAIAFRLEDGLSWTMGGESGRVRTEADLTPWRVARGAAGRMPPTGFPRNNRFRSEEHTSELQSLMRISYAVFCLKKKIKSI